jgi:hypothetical protein
MTLVIHELVTTLTQSVTKDYAEDVGAIRLYLIKYAAPAGSLYVEIQTSGGSLLVTSDTVTITDISAVAHFHGYVRFTFPTSYKLAADTTYKIVLKSTGYTFSELAYVGWCNAYEFAFVDADYSPSTGLNAPLLLEMYSYQRNSRGANG